MSKQCILVFGCGPLQVSLIENAKALGSFVIAIDPDNSAQGKTHADLFFQVKGDDFDKTLEIAQKYDVKGLVTAATDKPLLMMTRIAEAMNLRFPKFSSIQNTIDKSRFKKVLVDNGFLCAQGIAYNKETLPNKESVDYPVIIKPTCNSGSRGVVLCHDAGAFEKAVIESFSESAGEVLIEEYIQGDEISVEALVYNNEVHILQVTDKETTPMPYNVELCHKQPSKYKETYLDGIQEYLQRLINVLELNDCAIHPEFKITNKGLFLLEMGPRLGGDFMTSHLVPLSTGINMEQALIQIATGNNVDIKPSRQKSALVKYLELPIGAIIQNDLNIDSFYSKYRALQLVEITLKKNDVVTEITNSLNRYGHFILVEQENILDEMQSISEQLIDCLIKN